MTRDYRDAVIEQLALDEAAVLERVCDLEGRLASVRLQRAMLLDYLDAQRHEHARLEHMIGDLQQQLRVLMGIGVPSNRRDAA